jgi:ankyrin repeat protein
MSPQLFEACKANNVTLALSLLAEDVPPSYYDENTGFTCLYWAVVGGNIKLIKAIVLKDGSSQHHQAKQNTLLDPYYQREKILVNSPLLAAAYAGQMNSIWVLLADGFSPDDTDSLGNTAVHLAAAAGHAKILNVLIADGATISVFNKFRNIAEDIAISKETHDALVLEKERREGNEGAYSPTRAHQELLQKVGALSLLILFLLLSFLVLLLLVLLFLLLLPLLLQLTSCIKHSKSNLFLCTNIFICIWYLCLINI